MNLDVDCSIYSIRLIYVHALIKPSIAKVYVQLLQLSRTAIQLFNDMEIFYEKCNIAFISIMSRINVA